MLKEVESHYAAKWTKVVLYKVEFVHDNSLVVSSFTGSFSAVQSEPVPDP